MKTLHINKKDNVLIALEKGRINDKINDFLLLNDVEAGHKIALCNIKKNQPIIKYGESIGHATCLIKKGEHVHSHNMKTNLSGTINYKYNPVHIPTNKISTKLELTGYKRYNKKVGIRNELWVIVTVGCINSIANQIVNEFKSKHSLSDIDGIFTFNHPYGCSQMGEDQENTIQILRNIVMHPNAGGVLVLGLGCENNQLKPFYDSLGTIDSNRIRYLNCQDVENEIKEAVIILEEIYEIMRLDKREKIKFSDITFGLKCGGSDGFSGITANPLVGYFSDKMISLGANSILSEVPEMFGAEHILMNRACNETVFHKIVHLIDDYKNYFISHNQVVYENPSPGNKEGGITTLEEKSLGCIQKAGTSKIVDVLNYGNIRKKDGLSLLYGPGNDMVSVTAMASAHAQLVLFTTGRGTPFGGFVPTIKISTNTELYNKKKNWIDFNAGVLLENKTMEETSNDLIEEIVNIINGKKAKNEINNCREIAILKKGVTL
ncbi:MAG: UxaA family hydrolase [Erysipelotrichaceae bacterium]|jgi:altronate hydrolase